VLPAVVAVTALLAPAVYFHQTVLPRGFPLLLAQEGCGSVVSVVATKLSTVPLKIAVEIVMAFAKLSLMGGVALFTVKDGRLRRRAAAGRRIRHADQEGAAELQQSVAERRSDLRARGIHHGGRNARGTAFERDRGLWREACSCDGDCRVRRAGAHRPRRNGGHREVAWSENRKCQRVRRIRLSRIGHGDLRSARHEQAVRNCPCENSGCAGCVQICDARREPFQLISEFEVNPRPVTVSVKFPEPACALVDSTS